MNELKKFCWKHKKEIKSATSNEASFICEINYQKKYLNR